MDSVYLLNDIIYFYPSANKLVSSEDENINAVLTQPAARCFELLLMSEGLVQQKALYEYGWKENSPNVTPNTLYQNISIIRRSLKKLTPEGGDWIITIPKQGFRIDPQVSITRLTVETEVPVSPVKRAAPRPASSSRVKANRVAAVIFTCASLLLAAPFLTAERGDFLTVINRYQPSGVEGQCHFYRYQSPEKLSEPLRAAISQRVNCDRQPYVYVTHYDFIKTTSILSCATPFTQSAPTTCTSWSIRDTNEI